MKKYLSLLLVLLVTVTAVAGCAPNVADPGSSASSGNNVGTTPASVIEEPMKLNWIVHTMGYVPLQDTPVQKLIEERFNVDITVAEVDTWQADTIAVYLASSPQFDFMCPNVSFNEYAKYYTQGLLRTFTVEDLNEHMPTWMDACYAMVGEDGKESADTELSVMQKLYDGKLFVVPTVAQNYQYVMGIRQDWLDNLGLSVPTTYDQLVETLRAFTYDDPDGNGKNDTYGIDAHSVYKLNYLHLVDGVLPKTFALGDDGQVSFVSSTDAWKDNMKRCSEIYSMGVIDPEWVTDTRAIVREKWASGKFGVTVDATMWFLDAQSGNIVDMVKSNDPKAEVTFLDPLPTEDGTQYVWSSIRNMYATNSSAGAFGAGCSDEKMYKIMEILETAMTDKDFWIACNYGEEGIEWNTNEDGVISATKVAGETEHIQARGGCGGQPEFIYQRPVAQGYDAELVLPSQLLELQEHYAAFSKYYYGINFPYVGINEAYNASYADVNTLAEEYYYNAITGKISVDATWDDYIASLNSAGLKDIISEYQTYVDTYMQ